MLISDPSSFYLRPFSLGLRYFTTTVQYPRPLPSALARSQPHPFSHFAMFLPELDRTAFDLPRERLDPVLRHKEGVLELRRPTAVRGRRRPIVLPHVRIGQPLAYHRFDREDVSRLHRAEVLIHRVVVYVRGGVED